MTTTGRFSTTDFDPSERLASWNQLMTDVYRCQVVATPRPETAFQSVLQQRSYDDVLTTQVRTSPSFVRCQPWEAARDVELVALKLQDWGTSDYVCGDKRLQLQAGTAVMNPVQASAHACDELSRFLLLIAPMEPLAQRIGKRMRDLVQLFGMRVDASAALLLTSFLRALLSQEAPTYEPDCGDAIGDVILDLIAITYRCEPATPVSSVVTDHMQRAAREFVERRLGDPELSTGLIARHLGVTSRSVQLVFAKMGMTATGYIRRLRLERAAQLLVDGGDPVSDVAARVGYSDLSHFYRSFRRHYGVSPKRYSAR